MQGLANDLGKIVDAEKVKTDAEDLFSYSSDATYDQAHRVPDAVVLPDSTEDVCKILKYAGAHQIPVTPRGAGSGIAGGCTPLNGGIVLDMKRMNHIIEINRGNLTARSECGVVLSNFHKAVEKENLFYPPDPQSMSVCTLGGNVATRAGGPHGVKYGTTPNYVLGLEVVLSDGSIINTGSSCVKHSVGYDLTHLFTGSEGTLGVVTKITTRLIPLPPARKTVVIVCETIDQAAEMVSAIIANGIVPAMLEFISQAAVKSMNKFISPPLNTDGAACLMIKLDGSALQIDTESQRIFQVCQKMKALESRVIKDEKDAAAYWYARSSLYPLSLAFAKKVIVEDITVPRNRIPDFMRSIQRISAATGVHIGASGHAGDGNIHPIIILNEVNDKIEKQSRHAIEELIKCGLEFGGSISGEHGIGFLKSEFLVAELGQRQVDLMKQIKKAVDPAGIMNPGKIWQEGEAV